MSLAPLPTALLLPPVNLVPLGLVGLLLARRYPRLGRALNAFSLIGLLLFALPCVSQGLSNSLQSGIPRSIPSRPPKPPERSPVLMPPWNNSTRQASSSA